MLHQYFYTFTRNTVKPGFTFSQDACKTSTMPNDLGKKNTSAHAPFLFFKAGEILEFVNIWKLDTIHNINLSTEKKTQSLCALSWNAGNKLQSPFLSDKCDMILGLLENLMLHALLLLWQVVVTGELATVAHKTLKDLLAEECLYFAAESSYCLNKMWHERSHCHPEQTDDSTTKCRWFTAHIVQAVRAVHSWLTTWPRENHNTADTTPKLLEKLRCSRVLPAFQKIFFIWLHIIVKKFDGNTAKNQYWHTWVTPIR